MKDILPLSMRPLMRTLRRIGSRGIITSPARVGLLALRAPFLEFCQWSQGKIIADEAPKIPDPFFILGYWRSGTTFLHELLSLDERFIAPTTHQCFNPHTFLLPGGQGRRSVRSVQRPMDAMTICADSPQEHEFALLGIGAPSPYEHWLAPRRMADNVPYGLLMDASAPETRRWAEALTRFVCGFAGRTGGHRTPLLKSPADSFRIPLLLQRFPHARFVYLVRRPDEVFVSARRTFIAMLERYALEPYRIEDVEAYLISTRILLETCLAIDTRVLCTGNRICTIDFADLIGDPRMAIERLYAYYGLDPTPDFAARLDKRLAAMKNYRVATRPAVVPQEIANLTELITPCPIHFS